MPIPARGRQARHLNAQHQSNIAEADLRDQALKANAAFDACAYSPEIVIHNHDGLACPSQLEGPVNERVLQTRRLLVTLNLLHRGLPDVNHREALAMLSEDLVGHEAALTRHEIPVAHRLSP